MRGFHWTDFEWDPAVFPDPAGMLARLKERGLQHLGLDQLPTSPKRRRCSKRARRTATCLQRPNGDVWQWDLWQPGMGDRRLLPIPAACRWFKEKLAAIIDMGVDSIKTDFGERIPTDVVYHDGSDPVRMHNYYTQLYNQTVFEVLEEKCGRGQGRPLCPIRDGRRAAVPDPLGRRLLVRIRGDGGQPPRRALPLPLRLRLLEPRHRWFRRSSPRRALQAVGRLRPPLLP